MVEIIITGWTTGKCFSICLSYKTENLINIWTHQDNPNDSVFNYIYNTWYFLAQFTRFFNRWDSQICSEKKKKARSSHPGVFLGKGVLKICSKFTGEHPCRKVISIKLQSNFVEITLRHGCCPVNLLHIFRTPFSNEHLWVATSGKLIHEVSNWENSYIGITKLAYKRRFGRRQ